MQRAQAWTRQDYDYRVSIERSGATPSMRLPLGKYTAGGKAVIEGSTVLLEEADALSTMLQRELAIGGTKGKGQQGHQRRS